MSAVHSDEEKLLMEKVHNFMKAKDDTFRFMGLALLKSILDNRPNIREDEQSVRSLWESISPRFMDRLIRTGSGQNASQDSKEMLNLAVSVLHTFANLLPDDAKSNPRFVDRIPLLVSSLLHSSAPTEELILQTLASLVSQQNGAVALIQVDDLSPLTEIAPSHPLVLDIFSLAWLQSMTAEINDGNALAAKIERTIESLVASFKGTDAVTLLACLADLLRKLDPKAIPPNPTWIKTLVDFIHNLVTSRATAAGRSAYTNLAATLLQVYPAQAAPLLFSSDDSKADKPFSYLLINLLLIDIRSSFPTLLEELNSPSYSATSARLASAFDVISNFIGFLVRSLDDDSSTSATPLTIPPDRLLSLRKAISETMSSTIEYLRDRWDASVAGALGLHPSARAGTTSSSSGSRPALAWDSKTDDLAGGGGDTIILAAMRALAIWLREDDGEVLRHEAAGLTDMFMDLYLRGGKQEEGKKPQGPAPDFRRPILVALEGITAVENGTEALLDNDGWRVLSEDMIAALQETSTSAVAEDAAARGVEIVRVLLPIAEAETPGPREEWMAVVTKVAAWRVPDDESSSDDVPARPLVVEEFWIAVLQLVTALLDNAHLGMRRRYKHSTDAILGVGNQLRELGIGDEALSESLDDVMNTLGALD